MKVKLTPDGEWTIRHPDEWNYELVQTRISTGKGSNTSEEPRLVEKTLGYFSTLEGAIRRWVRAVESEKTEDFVGSIEELANRIENCTNDATEKVYNLINKHTKGEF